MDTFRNCYEQVHGFSDRGAARISEKAQPGITAFSRATPKPLSGMLEPIPCSISNPINLKLNEMGSYVATQSHTRVKTYAFSSGTPKPNPEYLLYEPTLSLVSEVIPGTVEIPKDVSAELTSISETAKQVAEKAARDKKPADEQEFNHIYEDLRRLSALSNLRPLTPTENELVETHKKRISETLNNPTHVAGVKTVPDEAGPEEVKTEEVKAGPEVYEKPLKTKQQEKIYSHLQQFKVSDIKLLTKELGFTPQGDKLQMIEYLLDNLTPEAVAHIKDYIPAHKLVITPKKPSTSDEYHTPPTSSSSSSSSSKNQLPKKLKKVKKQKVKKSKVKTN